MKKMNQAGSAIVAALLALILVVAIGGVGYYVYHTQKSKKSDNNVATTVSSHAASDTTAMTAAQSDYLEIPELGVKVKLSDDIRDAYYVIKTANNPFGGGDSTYAALSTHALAKALPGCAAESDGLAGAQFGEVTSSDPNAPDESGYGTIKSAFKNGIELNGKYYFVVTGHQSVCDENIDRDGFAAQTALFDKVRTAFDNAQVVKL